MVDLLVVGGGVTGACIARAAAGAGLSTALVERDDFGAGTSANSLKILHGGLRDLRRLAPAAVRAGAREQAAWVRSAPHLVGALPFLLPTYRGLTQSRTALRLALTAADALSHVPAAERLGGWRILDRAEAFALVPDLPGPVTGGGLWHEGQMYSAERLVLEVVRRAMAAGAGAANHTEATALLRAADGAVVGARVRDVLNGEEHEVRARRTLVAAGAGSRRIAARLLGRAEPTGAGYSLALNVLLPDRGHPVAFALRSRVDGVARQLLFVPWRGRTILGTGHYSYSGDPASFDPAAVDPGPLLAEADAAWNGPRARAEDVLLVHAGLLPLDPSGRGSPDRLLRAPAVHDHAGEGAPGLISVVSVRFSYAGALARAAVRAVARSLGRARAVPRGGAEEAAAAGARRGAAGAGTASRRGEAARALAAAAAAVRQAAPGLAPDVRRHLARCYGADAGAVVAAMGGTEGWDRRVVPGEPVIFGQLVHGARAEMARTVDDLVWRRTEIGPRGLDCPAARQAAAEALEAADIPARAAAPDGRVGEGGEGGHGSSRRDATG